ncbi:MAG: ferrochelatase [bacterium]
MKAVILMSYGSIYTINDVERFYTHILKGKRPSDHLIQELRERFLAIGGKSPLNEISKKQADKLQKFLNTSSPDPIKVYLAFKHIDPYIEDVVKVMEDDGVTQAVALILSPYYSNYNISDYFKRTQSNKIKFHYVYGYYNNPLLIQAFKRRIESLVQYVLKRNLDDKDLYYLFSAHSLPEKILPDCYPEQLSYVVNQLVDELGIKNYGFAYQSAGKGNEKWLGPDILEVVENLPHEYTTIISCPIGFISDHLEVLYDVDIEAKQLANQKGFELYRINLFNDDDDFIEVLAHETLNSFNQN